MIGKQDLRKYLPKLKPAASFRGKWIYNSYGYSIVGELLEKVTDKPLSEILKQHVTSPLGLTRTTTQANLKKTKNFADPYAALENGTRYHLQHRQDFRNHFFEAAAGVYTTLYDMMIYAKAVVQGASGVPTKTASSFSKPPTLFSPSFRERSYALGWIRALLPGVLGVMGDNIRVWDTFCLFTCSQRHSQPSSF